MEIKKSKVSILFLLIFRQSGGVLFFLYARRLRGYTATGAVITTTNITKNISKKNNLNQIDITLHLLSKNLLESEKGYQQRTEASHGPFERFA